MGYDYEGIKAEMRLLKLTRIDNVEYLKLADVERLLSDLRREIKEDALFEMNQDGTKKYHLTDTQRRDYAIRHNRTAELSGWDFGKLEEQIARLEIEGVDLSGLKFDLDVLNGGDNTESDKEVPLKEKYQLIVDCEDEADMQEKYNVLQEAGIECRVSTL